MYGKLVDIHKMNNQDLNQKLVTLRNQIKILCEGPAPPPQNKFGFGGIRQPVINYTWETIIRDMNELIVTTRSVSPTGSAPVKNCVNNDRLNARKERLRLLRVSGGNSGGNSGGGMSGVGGGEIKVWNPPETFIDCIDIIRSGSIMEYNNILDHILQTYTINNYIEAIRLVRGTHHVGTTEKGTQHTYTPLQKRLLSRISTKLLHS